MRFQKTEERLVNRVVELPTAIIKPNPDQPRRNFDEDALARLAVSIKQNGVLQPLTVRKVDGEYFLIAGERRLRAAKLVNLDHVPCIVTEKEDRESAIIAILENIQRADLNYLEEAEAIKRLITHYGLTQEEAAASLGVAQSTVANKLRLLKLSASERETALNLGLNERQARAALRLPEELRERAMAEISARQLNSAQTDRFVEELLKRQEPKPKIINKTEPKGMLGLYLNSFSKTVKAMREAGIPCESEKRQNENTIEYVIKIKI